MKIYIGNLSTAVTETDLAETFSQFGVVVKTNIVKDSLTGESKGYGFVEMEDKVDAEEAIQALDESSLKGSTIVVNRARPRNAKYRRRNRH